jgi:hypothetical protein
MLTLPSLLKPQLISLMPWLSQMLHYLRERLSLQASVSLLMLKPAKN